MNHPRGCACPTCRVVHAKGCRAHCRACERCFGGVRAFDKHQVGVDPVQCHHPASKGLQLRSGVWGQPPPDKAAFATPSAESDAA